MSPLRRLVCWLLGHNWRDIRYRCHRSLVLGHLHHLAGAEARCGRCGEDWDDVCGPCRAATKRLGVT